MYYYIMSLYIIRTNDTLSTLNSHIKQVKSEDKGDQDPFTDDLIIPKGNKIRNKHS